MAGKVNTKFVVVLSVVMVMLFGAAMALTLWIKGRSAEDLAKLGDTKMAAKEYEQATQAYSRAVNKEQTNPVYVEKWLSAMQAWMPGTMTDYQQRYQGYIAARRTLARLKVTDMAAHREFLNLAYEPFMNSRFDAATAEKVVAEVERTLGLFKGQPAENAEGRAIRRYRGLVRVRQMGEPGIDLTPEQVEQAKADLEAALAANPRDAESALGITNWHNYQAAPLRRAEKTAEADALQAKGREALEKFCATTPDSPLGQTVLLILDLEKSRQGVLDRLKDEKDPLVLFNAMKAGYAGLRPRLDSLAEIFKTAPADEIKAGMISQLRFVEGYIDPSPTLPRSRAAIDRMLQSKPDDARMVIAGAQLTADTGDLDGALAQLQKVVDFPKRPLSLDGIQLFDAKGEALFLQASFVFQKWEQAKDDASRSAQLDQAQKLRAAMLEFMGPSAGPVLFVDAMTAFAKNDLLAAKEQLQKFNEMTGNSNISTLWTLAQTERRLNNNGAARRLLEIVTQRRGELPGPHVMIAEIDYNTLKKSSEAVRRLAAVLASEPNYAPAKALLKQILIGMSKDEADTLIKSFRDDKPAVALLNETLASIGQQKTEDPVVGWILEAERMLEGADGVLPNTAGAQAFLEEKLKESTDPRLFTGLALLMLQIDTKESGLAVIDRGLKSNPSDPTLTRMRDLLSMADPVKGQIDQINEAKDVSELDKAIQRAGVYSNASQNDKAREELLKARGLAPDDTRVLDRLFQALMRDRDIDASGKLVEEIAAKNLDRADGNVFKGRWLVAQNRTAEAITAFEYAVNKGVADVNTMRLLGRLYAQQNRFDDADRVFREALRLQPNSVPTIIDQINALSAAGRKVEAFEQAAANVRLARGYRDFTELYLRLQAEVGSQADALAVREQLLKTEPNNATNRLELARMSIRAKRFDEARSLIASLKEAVDKKRVDPLEAALLNAELHTAEGKPELAQAAMDDYLKGIDPKDASVRPFMAFGQFFADRRMHNEAVAMIERGRAFQSPKVMECDRQIGDMLSMWGLVPDSLPYYQRVVDGNADGENQEVRIRLVELMSALGKYQEASKYMEGVKPGSRTDSALPLLRAEIAAGLGNDQTARELFGKAVGEFPQDPMVYARRAQYFLRKTPPKTDDALMDLDLAIKVRPNYWQARKTRALVYLSVGRRDDAIRDLRDAVRTNPMLDDMRLSLMRELIGLKRPAEAAELADEAMRVRPNDVGLAMSFSTMFLNAADWARAQQYAAKAWDLDKRIETGEAYLDTLLNSEPKNISAAERVLKDLQPQIGKSYKLLTARAKVLVARNRMPEAIKDLNSALEIIPLNGPTMLPWWQDARRALVKPEEAIEFLQRGDRPKRAVDWAAFLRASVYAESPDPKVQIASAKAFQEITENAKDPVLISAAFRMWGTVLYQGRKHAEAADAWKKGLEKTADDPELLNNLAYVLARHLGKPEEAVPHAEKAVELQPTNADALDTLGLVYLMIGKYDEAEKQFKAAAPMLRTDSQRIAVTLHTAELWLKRGDKEKARGFLRTADELIGKNPPLAPTYKPDADELRSKIGTP